MLALIHSIVNCTLQSLNGFLTTILLDQHLLVQNTLTLQDQEQENGVQMR